MRTADATTRPSAAAWGDASWLFLVEPVGEGRSRLISRYRCSPADDVASRVAFGRSLLEPIGFAKDRRMLLGVKARVESAEHH